MKQDIKTDEKLLQDGKNLVNAAILLLEDKNYEEAKNKFINAQVIFTGLNASEYISVCLSMIGLIEYSIDRKNYQKALSMINDGAYMAKFSKNITANLFNEFALGSLDFGEKSNDLAIIHYNNAKNFGLEYDEF